MKKLAALSLFAALAVAGTAFCATPASSHAWIGARPSTKIAVSSIGNHRYRINATIRDLRNGKVLSRPELITKAGAPAEIRVGRTGSPGDTLLSFTITVAADGKSAAYRSSISRNGEVMTSQEGTLAVGG